MIQDAIEKHKKKDLIVHRDVKLDNYAAVVELMKNPDTGVPLKQRTSFFIPYLSFLGSELVDWILKVTKKNLNRFFFNMPATNKPKI